MKRIMLTLTIIGLAAILAGCTSSPRTTAPLGHSVRANMQRQVLNPGAPDLSPVMGLDGEYAEKAYEKYQTGFGAKKESGTSEALLFTEEQGE